MKRISLFFLLVFAVTYVNYAQNNNNSLDGWHLGARVEGDILQPLSIRSVTSASSSPFSKSHPTLGWAVGIEASYNFARYFGVSVGLDFGTTTNFINPNSNLIMYGTDFKIPVNFEVHVPLKENWHFYTSAGLCFSNFGGGLEIDLFQYSEGVTTEGWNDRMHYVDHIWSQKPYVLSIDATIKLGAYYTLPYKDVIRFGIVGNLGSFNKYTGTYNVFSKHDNLETEVDRGYFNYRYNGLGVEVAYIHCFKKKQKE